MMAASDTLLPMALVCMVACHQTCHVQAMGQGSMLDTVPASFHDSAATQLASL